MTGERTDQCASLIDILSRLGGTALDIRTAQLSHDQLVQREPGWIRHVDRDAGTVQGNTIDLLVQKKVEIAQHLGVRAQRGQGGNPRCSGAQS